MPQCNRDLDEIISKELDNKDIDSIRAIVLKIVKCVAHLHDNGFIHGDLKPKNIMRSNGSFLLIDFDASAYIGSGYAGKKVSTAYSSPELLYKKDNSDEYGIKYYNNNLASYDEESKISQEYSFLSASPSQDAWALGMTIYFLLTRSSFFQSDIEGENICNSKDLKNLYHFSDSFKQEMLEKITDLQARNLLSNLLNKTPTKRPNMIQVIINIK
jgi:serine/threonine protein kinase